MLRIHFFALILLIGSGCGVRIHALDRSTAVLNRSTVALQARPIIFEENFIPAQFDYPAWTFWGNLAALTSLPDAILFTPPTNTAPVGDFSNVYVSFHTNQAYDLTDRAAYAEWSHILDGGAASETTFDIYFGVYQANFVYKSASIEARLYTSGYQTVLASASFISPPPTPVEFRFVRFRHDSAADLLYWEYSADNVTWNTLASSATPLASVNGVNVSVSVGNWSNPTPGYLGTSQCERLWIQ